MLLNVVTRELRFIMTFGLSFRVSCRGLEMALVSLFLVSVWEYPYAENCLSLSLCLINLLFSVEILLANREGHL